VPGTALCTVYDGQGTGWTIFQWVAQLNAAKFAGYTDWRIPNVRELESIVDYGSYNPYLDAVFGASCFTQSGCTVDGAGGTTECSCTQSNAYASSTTYAGNPGFAGRGGRSVVRVLRR
jgi:hypothetical protein